MALRIVLSAAARADLLDLWAYVAADDQRTADTMLDRVLEVAQKLAEWPEMGRERPELRPDIRSSAVGSHILFYRVQQETLELVRIVHGRRDIDAIF